MQWKACFGMPCDMFEGVGKPLASVGSGIWEKEAQSDGLCSGAVGV